MKIRNIILIISVALFLAGTSFGEKSQSDGSRPYLGVLLDSSPLPELLTKHLGLSPGQGIRLRNIQNNSPAEEAGLERDDIIISIQGEDVYDSQSIVDAVQKASVGEEISLEIIHLGQRKTMKIKLGVIISEPDWKYPLEPEIEQLWRPGRLFRLKPGDTDWAEIFSGDIPADVRANMDKIYKGFRFYFDGYRISIEGDPADEDSLITISKGDTKYTTTIKEINKMPDEYREAAERALENAREKRADDFFTDSQRPPADIKKFFFRQIDPGDRPSKSPPKQEGQMLDNIQKQMNQLMEKIKELEKSQGELLDRLAEKKEIQKTKEQPETIL